MAKPVPAGAVYSWQAPGPDQKERILQRQQVLREADLSIDAVLLTEWFALIQLLDILIRREAESQGYRPRSHSLPMAGPNASPRRPASVEVGGGGSHRIPRIVRKPRSGTFQDSASSSSSRQAEQRCMSSSSPRKAPPRSNSDRKLNESMEAMREQLREKDAELRRMKVRACWARVAEGGGWMCIRGLAHRPRARVSLADPPSIASLLPRPCHLF